jgi:hypothetical protein
MMGGEQPRCLNRTAKTKKHKRIGKDKNPPKKRKTSNFSFNRGLMLDLGMYLMLNYLAILM